MEKNRKKRQITLSASSDSSERVSTNSEHPTKSSKRMDATRFRVIPKKADGRSMTEAKFHYPVLYLGLSRLFPIGESQDSTISTRSIAFKSAEHKQWFVNNYKSILSMQSQLEDVTNYSISETDRKSGIGISTDTYDYLANSSGQDNLGQILLSILSFKKLKEEMGEQWTGGLLLIDEIDATLHPAAQRKIIDVFVREARDMGIQIVVTTHSLSCLRNICEKTAHNKHDDSINNIELYYFTNANRKLEIKRNIPYTEIESDLMINSIVQSNNKIKLYSEDAEARWFLAKLIPDYLHYIDILDVSIGCDQLINLYTADIQYFGNTLIVLDGDVSPNQLNRIPTPTYVNLGNILRLPGGKRPEEVIYNYLLSLEPDHDFWCGPAKKIGFTWDYFNEHGPMSEDYRREKERERYKAWFIDHQHFLDSTKLMDFWRFDNRVAVDSFCADFKKAHNRIAERMLTYTIED